MNAEIISIGDELLIGDTINTNAAWLGEFLSGYGFTIKQVHTISDDLDLIKATIQSAMMKSDLVITTGGLGPTHDDLTKKAVADLFEVKLKLDQQTLDYVKAMFEKRNIPFSKSNYHQAEVPENAEVLFNKAGTAPGMWFEVAEHFLAVLPGVPYEMKYLMKNKVTPLLREKTGDLGYFYKKYIKTAGVGESTLSDKVLGDLSDYMKGDTGLAFLPSAGGVTLRISARGEDKSDAIQKTEALSKIIYEKAGDFIFGEGKDLELSEAVGRLLKEKGYTIATAESCTGGLVSNAITDIPGSSEYMMGGIISYANSVKEKQLGVQKEDLDEYGAVSRQVALQMARGVAIRLNADIGISTTGIAGPGGGTPDKPVGTVWIGFYRRGKEHFALKTRFSKDRLLNKERSKMVALECIRRVLKGIETMPYDLKRQSD